MQLTWVYLIRRTPNTQRGLLKGLECRVQSLGFVDLGHVCSSTSELTWRAVRVNRTRMHAWSNMHAASRCSGMRVLGLRNINIELLKPIKIAFRRACLQQQTRKTQSLGLPPTADVKRAKAKPRRPTCSVSCVMLFRTLPIALFVIKTCHQHHFKVQTFVPCMIYNQHAHIRDCDCNAWAW